MNKITYGSSKCRIQLFLSFPSFQSYTNIHWCLHTISYHWYLGCVLFFVYISSHIFHLLEDLVWSPQNLRSWYTIGFATICTHSLDKIKTNSDTVIWKIFPTSFEIQHICLFSATKGRFFTWYVTSFKLYLSDQNLWNFWHQRVVTQKITDNYLTWCDIIDWIPTVRH